MKTTLARIFALCLALESSAIHAANPPAPAPAPDPAASGLNLGSILSFAQGLEINPKVVTETGGGSGTTVGLDYKFDRGTTLMAIGPADATDVAFAFKSSGTILAEPDKIPNNLFTHTLRLSLINLWPSDSVPDDSAAAKADKIRNAALARKFDNWQKLAGASQRTEAEEAEMNRLVHSAAVSLREVGPLRADYGDQSWNITSKGKEKDWASALKDYPYRPLFLSADLDGNLEHDQSLTNVQFVGSAQIRGKILSSIFDVPFQLIRRVTGNDTGEPKNWLNRAGGPYFWGGVGYVESSENDARQSITTDHKIFPRAHAGVSYRTEIFGTSEANSVALELSWRYYHEFDAPKAIRSRHLDHTSYFKATLLFPGNYFLEYTDGKLPLDVEGASTVSVGWRYNF